MTEFWAGEGQGFVLELERKADYYESVFPFPQYVHSIGLSHGGMQANLQQRQNGESVHRAVIVVMLTTVALFSGQSLFWK